MTDMLSPLAFNELLGAVEFIAIKPFSVRYLTRVYVRSRSFSQDKPSSDNSPLPIMV